LFANKGSVSLVRRKALLDRTKRSSQMEKGVSFFLPFRYYDSCYYVPLS